MMMTNTTHIGWPSSISGGGGEGGTPPSTELNVGLTHSTYATEMLKSSVSAVTAETNSAYSSWLVPVNTNSTMATSVY